MQAASWFRLALAATLVATCWLQAARARAAARCAFTPALPRPLVKRLVTWSLPLVPLQVAPPRVRWPSLVGVWHPLRAPPVRFSCMAVRAWTAPRAVMW